MTVAFCTTSRRSTKRNTKRNAILLWSIVLVMPFVPCVQALDLTNDTVRQWFVQAAQDASGQYQAPPSLVPKNKGYLRRDDGRRGDMHAPDAYDHLRPAIDDVTNCTFLTSFNATITTPYVTKGVVLDTVKVMNKARASSSSMSTSMSILSSCSVVDNNKNNNNHNHVSCPSAVAVSIGQCGASGPYIHTLDWTAVTRNQGDVLQVACPRHYDDNNNNNNSNHHHQHQHYYYWQVTEATCHADYRTMDIQTPFVTPTVTVTMTPKSALVQLIVTPETAFTCWITCQLVHDDDDD